LIRSYVLAIAIVLLSSATSSAQLPLRSTQFDAARPALQPVAQIPVSEGRMILGGLLGGAIGFFGGGFAGALINDDQDGEDELEVVEGFAVGAVIGETLLLPLGVNIANYRQGSYSLSLLAATAITAVGLAFATSGEDELEFLIPVPVLQLISSVMIEKRTTK